MIFKDLLIENMNWSHALDARSAASVKGKRKGAKLQRKIKVI